MFAEVVVQALSNILLGQKSSNTFPLEKKKKNSQRSGPSSKFMVHNVYEKK